MNILCRYGRTVEYRMSPMFNMGGNMIGAKTLDLNKEFGLIRKQLDKLVVEWLR